jgi:hypothetical protein
MRKNCLAVVGFIFLVILVSPVQAQTKPPPKSKPRTVWIPPPAGSLLGGGYAEVGDDRPASKSSAATSAAVNNPALGKAVAELDAQSTTVVEGWALIAAAVANQTGVPVRTLRAQQAATKLTYGELLVANSLTSGTGKSFDEVVAIHRRGKSWSQMAKDFQISVDSITARAVAASSSIRLAESRRRVRREQHFKDTDLQKVGRTRHPSGP